MSDKSSGRNIEVIVEGDEIRVQGFVVGLFLGSSTVDWPVFNTDFGIEEERARSTLMEWVGLSEHLCHFVVREDSLGVISAALADPRIYKMSVKAARPIEGASFSAEFTVYSEEQGAKVREIFEKVPNGVTVEGFAPVVELHEDSKGVELYSPTHDYVMTGAASVSGDFRGVLYVHEQARRVEQIAETPLTLQAGEPFALDG